MNYFLKNIKKNLDRNNVRTFLQGFFNNYVSQTTNEIFAHIENDEKTLVLSCGGNIDYSQIKNHKNILIHEILNSFMNDNFTDKTIIDKVFTEYNKVHFRKIAKEPQVGLINGLYATQAGTGGITIIQTFKMPSEHKLALEWFQKNKEKQLLVLGPHEAEQR